MAICLDHTIVLCRSGGHRGITGGKHSWIDVSIGFSFYWRGSDEVIKSQCVTFSRRLALVVLFN